MLLAQQADAIRKLEQLVGPPTDSTEWDLERLQELVVNEVKRLNGNPSCPQELKWVSAAERCMNRTQGRAGPNLPRRAACQTPMCEFVCTPAFAYAYSQVS